MAGRKKNRYQVWFPGETQWELWLVDEDRGAVLGGVSDDLAGLVFRPRAGRRVFAVPARFLQCHTFYSSASDEKNLIAEAKRCLEINEAPGDLDGPGLQPVTGTPPRTLTRIDTLTDSSFLAALPPNLRPNLIVPSASLLPIPRQGLAIWREMGSTVAALERNGLVLSYLNVPTPCPQKAKESVGRWMAQLIDEKKTGRPQELHQWGEPPVAPAVDLFHGEKRVSARPAPIGLRSCIPLRPGPLRQQEEKSAARTKTQLRIAAVAASAFLALIFHALMSYSEGIIDGQRQELARLRKNAEQMELQQQEWGEVSLAVDPDASVLELWRCLVSLPLARSIKVNKMALSHRGISLSCQAQSEQQALGFIDQLAINEKFCSYLWDYSTPEIRMDGTALFEVWGEKSIRFQP